MANTLSKVAIDIVTEFKGAQNIKKAESSLSGLDAAVNKLGKRLAATFGAAELAKFGKDAVQAFAADQASAASLAKTLQNVGQGFADVGVERFIKSTETSTGVLDEKLRPAMETLVRATGDANKAQDLLTTSLDVAQGSGKDLATVSAALGKAYLGQTTALSKLGVGLTSAQLKGKSFADIQKQLNKLFGGQAADFANTYAGKIQKIGTAWENVKETIGKGLVDAFGTLSKNGSIDNFTHAMDTVAQDIAFTVKGLGDILAGIDSINSKIGKKTGFNLFGSIKNALGFAFGTSELDTLRKKSQASTGASTGSIPYAGGFMTSSQYQDYLKAQKTEKDRLAALNVEKNKQLKLDTAIAMLKKSMAIFDLQKIQIAAALQNKKLTADEENRLKLMQAQADLQQAIDDKNTAALDPLMQKIKDLQDQIAAISKLSAGNPFAEMLAGATAAGIATVALLNSIESRLPKAMVGLSSEAKAAIDESRLNPNSVPASPTSTGLTDAQLSQIYDPTVNVHVTLDGQVVANAVTNTVTSNQQTNSQAGVQPFWARNNVPNAGQW